MPLDFIVDFLCIVELVLRVYFFPVGFSQLEDNSTQQVATQLYDTKLSLAYDVIASMPIEIFASIPSVSLEVIPLLRLIHLLRILNFFPRLQQVEGHLVRKGLSWHRTTLMVVKSILAYTFANHWMACMFFFVHRYERHVQLTWVIADGYATFDEETGDISPYTDGEMVSMYILAITGGALGANLAGQLMTYLQGGDKCGAAAFKEKLRSVENYIRYRGLSEDIRAMILLTYHTMWSRERRSDYGKDSFLGLLPKPMAAEVAQELNASIIDMIIVTKHMRDALHGRMALFLRPQ
ncbi:Cnga2, partial [Symbiodinium microadriaticum]